MYKDFRKYEVFDDGRIWSYKKKRFLKPQTNKNGYQQIQLSDNDGKSKNYLVHRVVYEAVTGSPIPEGYEINHISEAKDENFFENLQLLTHKENVNFGSRNSRDAKTKSKLVGAFKDGELIMAFQSTREAGRNGFDQGNVARCCRGESKTHKCYEWKYI